MGNGRAALSSVPEEQINEAVQLAFITSFHIPGRTEAVPGWADKTSMRADQWEEPPGTGPSGDYGAGKGTFQTFLAKRGNS